MQDAGLIDWDEAKSLKTKWRRRARQARLELLPSLAKVSWLQHLGIDEWDYKRSNLRARSERLRRITLQSHETCVYRVAHKSWQIPMRMWSYHVSRVTTMWVRDLLVRVQGECSGVRQYIDPTAEAGLRKLRAT